MDENERIARRYCELMGLNPEEGVVHAADPDPITGVRLDVLMITPRWRLIAQQVPSQMAWFKALQEHHAAPAAP